MEEEEGEGKCSAYEDGYAFAVFTLGGFGGLVGCCRGKGSLLGEAGGREREPKHMLCLLACWCGLGGCVYVWGRVRASDD